MRGPPSGGRGLVEVGGGGQEWPPYGGDTPLGDALRGDGSYGAAAVERHVAAVHGDQRAGDPG